MIRMLLTACCECFCQVTGIGGSGAAYARHRREPAEGEVVFERAKFMVRFAGAYRRSRGNGGEHEAALQAATDAMFRTNRVNVPDSVYEMWSDPGDELGLDGGDWFGDGSLEITADHLRLLRTARLGWDGAER